MLSDFLRTENPMNVDFLKRWWTPKPTVAPTEPPSALSEAILQDEDEDRLQLHLRTLEEDEGGERVQMEADREIRTASEQSLKRLHVLQRGRCPQCGDGLRQHLFASVCDTCGWNAYSMPRRGKVSVHLMMDNACIEGDRCYVVKDNVTIVLKGEVVVARIPARALAWIEYRWVPEEVEERERQIRERLSVACGWCGTETNADKDGFHMAQVAFGATQERYCFCSDECFEAFRQMYPARVHRNCYERPCETCDLCVKRYRDEAEGIRTLAKDMLRSKPNG